MTNWAPSLSGKPVNLTNPSEQQVEFKELADTLAGVYLWNGTSYHDISAAFHTLIAFDAAPEETRPYVLLSNAHKARLGDTDPMRQEMLDTAERLGSVSGLRVMRQVMADIVLRQSSVFFRAAGLPFPSPPILEAVIAANGVATKTELRDFLLAQDLPRARGLEKVEPLKQVYRFKNKWTAADELYRKFQQYLPVLQQRGAAA